MHTENTQGWNQQKERSEFEVEQKGAGGSNILVISCMGIIGVLLLIGYFFYNLQPTHSRGTTGITDQGIEFIIAKGEGFREISGRLSKNSLIRSISVFKLYTLITGNAHQMKPGVYQLSGMMSIPEIVREIVAGGKNDVLITIPEGSTLKDIEGILVEKDIIREGELTHFDIKTIAEEHPFLEKMTTLEGLLFPDTYRFERETSVKEIVRIMLNTFGRKAWPLLENRSTWYNTLILASLVEREVITFHDRQIVAGILEKRMKQKIPLQVDATVSYVKCEGKFLGCAGIVMVRGDTRIASPFNTYQHLGLPPSPIANAGESAIKAVLAPIATPYFYYLSAAKSGATLFSKTLDEHNEKRVKYL